MGQAGILDGLLPDSAGGIERSLEMPDKYYALRSVLIAALLPGIIARVTGSAELALTEQSLQAIRDCMARSPYTIQGHEVFSPWA